MQPLKGITVVTLEHAIAAPFATRQLADMGARVVKIERPGVGDFARGYDERVRGLASHFVWTNRSKESFTLDVKHAEAQKMLMRLILDEADVVVQNLAPGAAARLGLSYDALAKIKPGIIVCDISGYGSDGPYRDKKAYDLLIQSEAGFVSAFTPDPAVNKTLAEEDGIWLNPNKTEIVLKIDSEAAGYFRRRKLLANQVIDNESEDGSLIVSCKVAHPNQILPIVRYWLPNVRILSPKGLQAEMESQMRGYLDLN